MYTVETALVQSSSRSKIHEAYCGHRSRRVRSVPGSLGLTIQEAHEKYGDRMCSHCLPKPVETAPEVVEATPPATDDGVLAADDVAQVVDHLRDRGLIHGAVVGASPVTGETIAQVADINGRSWVMETGAPGVWSDYDGTEEGHITPCETATGAALTLAWMIQADHDRLATAP